MIFRKTNYLFSAYKITFDFGQYGQQIINDTPCVDTKTISFRTPMCPILVGDEDLKVLFQIHENNILIQQIEFVYLTRMKFFPPEKS